MAPKRKPARRTSRKTSTPGLSSLWIVVIAVLAFLLVWSLTSNITRVDVGTVQGDLEVMRAQLTAQAAITEAPATEAPDAATEAPAEATEAPVATEAPTEPPAAKPETTCRVVNDYQLKDLTEVSSQPGSLIHVEWYERDGQPEYESVLPSGRYSVETPFPGGHVWEYTPNCSVDEVLDQVSGHIARRLQNLANNKGYRPWMDLVNLGFLSQVTSTSSVVVPDFLP